MSRRFLLILMLALLTFTLVTACSSTEEEPTTVPTVAEEEPTSDEADAGENDTTADEATPEVTDEDEPDADAVSDDDPSATSEAEFSTAVARNTQAAAEADADRATPVPDEENQDDAAAETPAVTPDPEPNFSSPGGEYYVAVTNNLMGEFAPPAEADPPEGFEWVVIGATLSNDAGETVEVTQESITLIDAEGNRYSPEPDDTSITPQLVGSTLAEGESVVGFARFAIPEGAMPDVLEWCVDEDCTIALQNNVP